MPARNEVTQSVKLLIIITFIRAYL